MCSNGIESNKDYCPIWSLHKWKALCAHWARKPKEKLCVTALIRTYNQAFQVITVRYCDDNTDSNILSNLTLSSDYSRICIEINVLRSIDCCKQATLFRKHHFIALKPNSWKGRMLVRGSPVRISNKLNSLKCGNFINYGLVHNSIFV